MNFFLSALAIVIMWNLVRIGADWRSVNWDDRVKYGFNTVWCINIIATSILIGIFWKLLVATITVAGAK